MAGYTIFTAVLLTKAISHFIWCIKVIFHMLPQHDPLFMQALADHEVVKRKKKNLHCAPRPNCNTLHGLHHLSPPLFVFFLPAFKGVLIITVTCEAILDYRLGGRGPRNSSTPRDICPDNTESMFHLCFQSSLPFHSP